MQVTQFYVQFHAKMAEFKKTDEERTKRTSCMHVPDDPDLDSTYDN